MRWTTIWFWSLLAIGIFTADRAEAQAIFTVNSTTDAVDSNIGDGVCETAGLVCTLRAAIQEANNDSLADVITLPAGNYALSINGSGEDSAATGDLDILFDVTINGASAGNTFVDASGLTPRDRVFHVIGTDATLNKFKVLGGRQPNGGGIAKVGNLTGGTLDLSQMLIDDNQATTGSGGGVSNTGAASTVRIANSTISNNNAAVNGGGVFNDDGTLEINNSVTVASNTATLSGGGIYNGAGGDADIRNSTIELNNTGTSGQGGGIANFDGTMNVQSCLVSDNDAHTGGGLFHEEDFESTVLDITDVVFELNVATGPIGGGGAYLKYGDVFVKESEFDDNHANLGDGGGVYVWADLTGIELSRVQVHDNTSNQMGGGISWKSDDWGVGTLRRSAIYSNTAVEGGGLHGVLPFEGDLGINWNTFSDNTSLGRGGGMFLSGTDTGAVFDITNCTIANNAATTSSAEGGGIYIDDPDGYYALALTIISQNTSATDTGPDCHGNILGGAEFTSNGSNLIGNACGDGDECPGFDRFGIRPNGDQVGGVDPVGPPFPPSPNNCPGDAADPLDDAWVTNLNVNPSLGILQDNGGNTQTHEIPSRNTALPVVLGDTHDAGAGMCTPTDQRLLTSPVGDCDIGAFEIQ